MALEVQLNLEQKKRLKAACASDAWPVLREYLKLVLEHNRNMLERESDDFLRGDCRRIRKLISLPEDIVAEENGASKAATRVDV